MEDIEYLYHQDIKEKKRIGYSAANKKVGAKSKKCRFPSDFLTKGEKNKLNGECKTYNMSNFYTWKDFMEMPKDIQIEYLRGIMVKYECSLFAISIEVFGMSRENLWNYCKRKGIIDQVTNGIKITRKGSLYLRSAVQKKLEACPETPDIPEDANPEPKKPIENYKNDNEMPQPKDFSVTVKDLSITTTGFDYKLLDFIASQYKGRNIEVTIIVKEH